MEKLLYDEQIQEQLYNECILPYENEIIGAILTTRERLDQVILKRQEQAFYNNPFWLKKRKPNHPKSYNTIADYPEWYCQYIRDEVYRLFWNIWEKVFTISGSKHSIKEGELLEKIANFKAKWWIVKRVHLIVENNEGPYFQNAIQIWNRYLDPSTDQVINMEWKCVEIIKINWQKKYREIRDFYDYIKVAESYRWDTPIMSLWFLWRLSLHIPFLLISQTWKLHIQAYSFLKRNASRENFELSTSFLDEQIHNQTIQNLPEDVRKNLLFVCERMLLSPEYSGANNFLLYFISNLKWENNAEDIKMSFKKMKEGFSTLDSKEKKQIIDYNIQLIYKIIEIYNNFLKNM